jgi:hypothetical protein
MTLNYGAFAGNNFGTQVPKLDLNHPQAPTVKSFHGITLVANGQVLGRIQNWNTNGAYTRGGTHVRELNDRTFGRFVDYVPGVADGYTITATMAEVWGSELEIQTGGGQRYIDLISQVAPFTAQEYWFRGNLGNYEVWTYLGCWLRDANYNEYTNEGEDLRVIRNLTFAYVSRSRSAGTV